MSDNDLFGQAAQDALGLKRRVLVQSDIPDNAGDGHVADRALANALVDVVQQYLSEESSEDDVELFFEVNGTQPADVESWAANILAGLRFRRIPDDSWRAITTQAVDRAVVYVKERSSLAWGS